MVLLYRRKKLVGMIHYDPTVQTGNHLSFPLTQCSNDLTNILFITISEVSGYNNMRPQFIKGIALLIMQ